jgi:hypothetical protein
MKIINTKFKYIEFCDYENVLNNFIKHFEGFPWIIGLGKFGEIRNPGISDLDLIVLTEDGFLKQSQEEFQNWLSFNKVVSNVIIHPPVFISESMLKNITQLHTLNHVKWIKKSKNIHIFSNNNQEILKIIWTTWLLVYMIPYVFLSKEIDLRNGLLLLKNLHQSCYNLTELIGDRQSDKLEVSNYLRTAWRNSDKNDSIANLVESELLDTYMQILTLLDIYSEKKLSNVITDKNIDIYLGYNLVISSSSSSSYRQNNNRFELSINNRIMNLFFNKVNSNLESCSKYFFNVNALTKKCIIEGVNAEVLYPFGRKQNDGYVERFRQLYRKYRYNKL